VRLCCVHRRVGVELLGDVASTASRTEALQHERAFPSRALTQLALSANPSDSSAIARQPIASSWIAKTTARGWKALPILGFPKKWLPIRWPLTSKKNDGPQSASETHGHAAPARQPVKQASLRDVNSFRPVASKPFRWRGVVLQSLWLCGGRSTTLCPRQNPSARRRD
jgi:hypothetical protein